jgi:ribonuclease/clavin/mitogillin
MAESGNLYEAVLARLAGGSGQGPGGPARPPARAAAAVVPWRRRPRGGIEVFWVLRSEALPFMGGWHAFPGGGLARGDAAVEVAGEPRGVDAGSFTPPDPSAADRAQLGPDLLPGLLACAVRELFEETGILLAAPPAAGAAADPSAAGTARATGSPPPATGSEAPSPPGDPSPAGAFVLPPAELAAARRALLAGGSFAELMRGLGAVADASRLVYAGRWLTPPFSPLRFDNRFFLLEWPAEETVQPEVVAGELTRGEWIEPGAAWAAWQRGEVLAAPPILHLLAVLHGDGPRAGLGRLLDTREADLGPLRRVELRPGVLMFPLATATLPPAATTNAYLLGHGEAVLVDPGAADPAEIERLAQALAAAQERLGRRATAIWLTHHHPDHVGGVAALARRFGLPVQAHAATAERLAAAGFAVDGELRDGERRVLAGDPAMAVRIVHTPGHARGHLCFFDEGGGSLLAGDMVAGIGTIVVDPPEGDMDDYLASLAKLLALAPRTLFPGHGPAVRDAAGKLREYIDHRLWREARVLAAWNEGRREPADMLATVYDDAPREALPLAERQVLAHLARLRRAGRLD